MLEDPNTGRYDIFSTGCQV